MNGSSDSAEVFAIDRVITLRRLNPTDLKNFQAYRKDPVVAEFQSWDDMSDETALGFLYAVHEDEVFTPGQWSQLAIADARSDELLGDMGVFLEADQSEAEIGITLAQHAQGRSFGKRAVEMLISVLHDRTQVQRLRIITDENNIKARALIARIQAFSFSHKDLAEDGSTELYFFAAMADLLEG